MRYKPVKDAPYAGAIRARYNATNADLVRDVMDAARHSARRLSWPQSIPTELAGEVMHDLSRREVEHISEDGDQLIRMPWRTLADGIADCKSNAILIGAMCAAAGRNVVLRFVQYEGDDWYGHVYAVVDGVPVDPQLDYGDEVLYCAHLDQRL